MNLMHTSLQIVVHLSSSHEPTTPTATEPDDAQSAHPIEVGTIVATFPS